MSSAIRVEHVSKVFTDHPVPFMAVKNINLTIGAGEFFVLLGPSGCGKSTLLRLMAGLDKPTSGHIALDTVTSPRDLGFVFQQFALLPWLTIYENVELGLLAFNLSTQERHTRIMNELKRFGLEKFQAAHPRDLSGGMQQRVGLARALVRKPHVLFLDEAFSELDSFTASRLRQELLQIWHETKVTIVMVTHIVEEAIELADRIAVLTPRPSIIERVIHNPLPRPRNRRSTGFFHLEDQLYALVKP